MFEKGKFFSLALKDELDIEQNLVQWFEYLIRRVMYFARKILELRFTDELSPKQKIEYTENWKREAKRYGSEWMGDFVEEIVRYSDESWIDIFGSYEDDPEPLIKAMVKFSEIVNEAEKKSQG